MGVKFPDRNLDHLYPLFKEKVLTVLNEMKSYSLLHCPHLEWIVVEGFRSAEYQNKLYQQGRSKPGHIVTFKDGYTHESRHQLSLAVDIAPKNKATGNIEWDCPLTHWVYLGHVYRTEKLIAGIDWPKLVDKPHGEWDPADKSTYNKTRQWQKQVGLRS